MWPNPQETADLVIFTEEIINGKAHFLCSDIVLIYGTHSVSTYTKFSEKLLRNVCFSENFAHILYEWFL